MCVCVGACRVTMVIEIKGHSSTFGCWCRITSQRWWIPLIETWTILNPYQFNTNVTVLWPSRYAGSCARRFLCMPRHRCQSHRLLGHWPLFAVRQVFLKPFFWSRTVQYKSNWNYGKMTRAFAFLPPFLLPRFAERLGADRVVLGRELSIKEIASVAADVDDLEVEAQCLISHSFWLWAEAHWNLPSTLNWFEGVLADLAVWKRENLLLTKSWLWYVVISGSFLVPSSSPWIFEESWSWLMLTTVGVCARCFVCILQRAMLLIRSMGWPLCKPWPVRASLPIAIWFGYSPSIKI